MRFPHSETDTTGSVGRPMANLDIKLVDDDGKDISGYDIRGELCIRGPTVVRGYFENPEANARDWDKDEYFHTGDIAYCDGKTKLWYIVDRKKVSRHQLQCMPRFCGAVLTATPTGAHQSASVSSRTTGAGRRFAQSPRSCRCSSHWRPRSVQHPRLGGTPSVSGPKEPEQQQAFSR